MQQRVRVLIVDDNVGLAENIAELLEGEGYEAVVAATAEEALPLALAHAIGVLITDFRLPGIDGATLVSQLRRRGCAARAMLISAYNDERTMRAARDAGAEFLAKPLDFSALSRFVGQLPAPP